MEAHFTTHWELYGLTLAARGYKSRSIVNGLIGALFTIPWE